MTAPSQSPVPDALGAAGGGGKVGRDRPIIFSGPMVRALLAGRKTQTRRILKPQPVPFAIDDAGTLCEVGCLHVSGERQPRVTTGHVVTVQKVPFAVGDRLWVRETWCHTGAGVWSVWDSTIATDGHVIYRADDDGSDPGIKWFSPIYLSRGRSRLTLIVTEVRVEQLNDISEADAVAEGCVARPFPGPWWQGYRDFGDGELLQQQAVGEEPPAWMIEPHRMGPTHHLDRSARDEFATLWRSLHGPDAWEANPWVVAVTFTVRQSNIDASTQGGPAL